MHIIYHNIYYSIFGISYFINLPQLGYPISYSTLAWRTIYSTLA